MRAGQKMALERWNDLLLSLLLRSAEVDYVSR